jgi:alpha-glucosidase
MVCSVQLRRQSMHVDQMAGPPKSSGKRSPADSRRDVLSWWQRAVIYEIAPISFQDSNGDGKGDLPELLHFIADWLGPKAADGRRLGH